MKKLINNKNINLLDLVKNRFNRDVLPYAKKRLIYR